MVRKLVLLNLEENVSKEFIELAVKLLLEDNKECSFKIRAEDIQQYIRPKYLKGFQQAAENWNKLQGETQCSTT